MLCSKVLEQFLILKKTDLKKTAMIKEIFQKRKQKNQNKTKQKQNKKTNDKKWVIDNDDDHELLL